MATTDVTIKIDLELKEQAEALFLDLGLTLEEVLVALMEQSVREQRIPFSEVPNAETMAAIEEVAKMKSGILVSKVYTNIDELFADFEGNCTTTEIDWGEPVGKEVW